MVSRIDNKSHQCDSAAGYDHDPLARTAHAVTRRTRSRHRRPNCSPDDHRRRLRRTTCVEIRVSVHAVTTHAAARLARLGASSIAPATAFRSPEMKRHPRAATNRHRQSLDEAASSRLGTASCLSANALRSRTRPWVRRATACSGPITRPNPVFRCGATRRGTSSACRRRRAGAMLPALATHAVRSNPITGLCDAATASRKSRCSSSIVWPPGTRILAPWPVDSTASAVTCAQYDLRVSRLCRTRDEAARVSPSHRSGQASLAVPPAKQRPVLSMGRLLEVAGAALDLHADDQPAIEQPGVAGLNQEVSPEVMLRVGDRPPTNPLEVGGDLIDTNPTRLLLSRGPHHGSL